MPSSTDADLPLLTPGMTPNAADILTLFAEPRATAPLAKGVLDGPPVLHVPGSPIGGYSSLPIRWG